MILKFTRLSDKTEWQMVTDCLLVKDIESESSDAFHSQLFRHSQGVASAVGSMSKQLPHLGVVWPKHHLLIAFHLDVNFFHYLIQGMGHLIVTQIVIKSNKVLCSKDSSYIVVQVKGGGAVGPDHIQVSVVVGRVHATLFEFILFEGIVIATANS